MQQQRGFAHKKSLGQHFLKSQAVAAQISDFLQPLTQDMSVLEIGPGAGILTSQLKPLFGRNLYVSELDPRAIEIIKVHPGMDEDRILIGDFLKLNLGQVFTGNFVLIGNFPYNISSQIVFRMLEFHERIPLMVGMFQREMAKRICAEPGSKDYGVITVCAALYYDSEYLLELPPDAFDPPPKVHSAVIRMRHRNELTIGFSEKGFRNVVKTAFQQRRKKVSNALKSLPGGVEALEKLGLSHLRAEDISKNQYIELAKIIFPEE